MTANNTPVLPVLIALVLVCLTLAWCDMRHATHTSDPSNILKELLS